MATQSRPADREQPSTGGSPPRLKGASQTVYASVHGHAQAIVVPRSNEPGRQVSPQR